MLVIYFYICVRCTYPVNRSALENFIHGQSFKCLMLLNMFLISMEGFKVNKTSNTQVRAPSLSTESSKAVAYGGEPVPGHGQRFNKSPAG